MKKRLSAFTLIELILALSIFSVVALSLYGAFASGMKIEQRAEKGGRLYREIRWALDMVAKDLENMVPYDFKNSYPEKLAFYGQSNKFSCIVPKESGLTAVSYYIRPPEEGSIYTTIIGRHYDKNTSMVANFEKELSVNLLIREERPFIESLQDELNKEPEIDVLSTRIKEASFNIYYAYIEGDQDNVQIVWKDSWEFNYLPSGVRVEITLLPLSKTEDAKTIQKDFFIPSGFLGRESS